MGFFCAPTSSIIQTLKIIFIFFLKMGQFGIVFVVYRQDDIIWMESNKIKVKENEMFINLMKKIKSNKGNSLAEFAVTTAMMATLATTAAPKFGSVGDGAKQKKNNE